MPSNSKDHKLHELYSRLTKINNIQPQSHLKNLNLNERKYQKNNILQQNQMSEIFDSIKKYQIQSQQQIKSVINQLLSKIKQIQNQLLEKVSILKNSQLQSIRDDIQKYFRQKKTTNKPNKINNILMQFQIGNNKVLNHNFLINKIQSKLLKHQKQIKETNQKILDLKQFFNKLELNFQSKNKFKNFKDDQISNISSHKEISIELNEDYSQQKRLLQNKFLNSSAEQNLMDDIQLKNQQIRIQKKQKFIQQISLKLNQVKTKKSQFKHENPQLSKKHSYQTISKINSNLGLNLNQFSGQLRKGQKKQLKTEIFDLCHQKIVHVQKQGVVQSFSRAKSLQNLSILHKSILPFPIELSKSKLSCAQNLSTCKPNTALKQLRSSHRSGNWSKILKDQQNRYNQMKNRIKQQ